MQGLLHKYGADAGHGYGTNGTRRLVRLGTHSCGSSVSSRGYVLYDNKQQHIFVPVLLLIYRVELLIGDRIYLVLLIDAVREATSGGGRKYR